MLVRRCAAAAAPAHDCAGGQGITSRGGLPAAAQQVGKANKFVRQNKSDGGEQTKKSLRYTGKDAQVWCKAGGEQVRCKAGGAQVRCKAGGAQVRCKAGGAQVWCKAGGAQVRCKAGGEQVRCKAGGEQTWFGAGEAVHPVHASQRQGDEGS